MPDSPSIREFDGLADQLKEGFDGVHARLDTLNHRTRKVEISVAVQWMLWIIVGSAVIALLPDLVKLASFTP